MNKNPLLLSLTAAGPIKSLAHAIHGLKLHVHLRRRVLIAFDFVQSILGRVDHKLGRVVAAVFCQLPALTLSYV